MAIIHAVETSYPVEAKQAVLLSYGVLARVQSSFAEFTGFGTVTQNSNRTQSKGILIK